MRKSYLLFLTALLWLPLQVWGQNPPPDPSGIAEGFEAGIPNSWTFSGPAGLDGVSTASSGISPTEGAQFAWISTGCSAPSGGTSCNVGTTLNVVATMPTPMYSSLGLGSGSTLGSPTVEATLTSPTFLLGSTDTISFDVNFVTTDGTNAFADFAVVQLVPVSPTVGSTINLFVANTTCSTCAAVPPVGLNNGTATLSPSTAYFAGLPVTLGPSTYGSIAKFGGGPGGAAGWVHVSFAAPAAGSYQLMFLVSHVGDTIYPSALAIDNVQTSTLVTPPQPVAPGTVTTFSNGTIDNQTVQIPPGASMNGVATMRVKFMQLSPSAFSFSTPNSWSGGRTVPAGTTCHVIASTGGKCVQIVSECFDAANNLLPTCAFTAGPSGLIELTSKYKSDTSQTHPALLIADDPPAIDYADITNSFDPTDPRIGGGTCCGQMQIVVVDELGSLPTDTIPPITTATTLPAPNGAGWNNTPVSVILTSTDDQFVKDINYSATGAQTIPLTTVPGAQTFFQISAQGSTTISFFAVDNAGNTETPKTWPVKIDTTPPTINITSPTNGATYTITQPVAASYTCTDPVPAGVNLVSGVATCAGPVASGSNIDTASVGSKTFTVNSTDVAGNIASASVNYNTVSYSICVLYDQTRSVKSGAVFPIKLYLCDASNNDLSSPAVVVHATGVFRLSSFVGAPESPGNANPDMDFRFDSTLGPSGGYIFNLSTNGLGSGTYTLQFTAGNDPTTHSVPFGVK